MSEQLTTKIALWGCGYYGETAYNKIITNNNYEIICVYDTDKSKIGNDFCGYEIIALDSMSKNKDYDMLLLCAEKWEAMLLMVGKYGVDISKIRIWDGNRIIRLEDTYQTLVNSQDGEEIYLMEKFSGKKNGVYVDVGAYHPTRFSNTFWAYCKGWRGVNIEPNPDSFYLFEIMRPEDINVNVGISSKKDTLKYYRFSEAALNTFDSNYAEMVVKEFGFELKDSIEVSVVPLCDIFRKNQIKHIDFIDIDVEEHEIEVIKSIRFDEVEIEVILVEQLDSNLESVISSEIAGYLKTKGYLPVSKYNRTVIYARC